MHINSTDKSIPYIINFSTLDISIYAVYKDRGVSTHSIRISLSYKNTMEEVDKFIEVFDKVYNKLMFKK